MWRRIAILAGLLPLLFVASNPIKAASFHIIINNHFDGENPSTWFIDQDGDGYGNPSISVTDSIMPTGFVSENTDCNDSDATIHPMAQEICNSIDDDCSGIADDHPVVQPINPAWQSALGGSRDDEGRSVIACRNGGYLIAGCSNSTDGNLTAWYGNNDAWLMRLDDNGALLWQQSYGNTGDDYANIVMQTRDNGFLFAGPSNSSLNQNEGSHGSQDFWIVKIDSSGVIQWQKFYGGTMADVPLAMDVTPDGGYVIAGTTYSNDGNATGNHGGGDYWVIKIDSGGTLQWQKTLGGSAYDFAHAVVATRDSSYLVAGYARSSNGDVALNNGQEDLWILKLDRNGSLLWQKSYGGTGGDGATAARQTADGGYLLTGTTHSYNIDVVGSHGGHEIWLVKIDGSGNMQWSKCFGGTSHDDAADLKICNDGGAILAGITTSVNGDVTENNGISDYWLVKVNESGSMEWQTSLGGSAEDVSSSVDQDQDGNFIVTGYTLSNNGDVSGNHGSMDAWILKVIAPQFGTYYLDADGDSFGSPESSVLACSAPAGFVHNQDDCNDSDPHVFPGQTEVCNGIDDDCDSYADENSMIASITPLATVTICSASNLNLVCANAGEGYTYQWTKYGVDLPGETNSTMQVNTAGMFAVRVNQNGCSSTSPATIVKLTDPIAPVSPSGTVTTCNGKKINFNTSEFPGMAFQWYSGTKSIPGATQNNYSTTAQGNYFITVTDITGCSFTSATSTLVSYAAPNATITVSGSTNICNTGSVTFTVPSATGNLYQWYKDNAAMYGATLNTYTATQAGSYKALVTSVQGCTKYSPSKNVKSCREEGETATLPNSAIEAFPNPTTGEFFIRIPDGFEPEDHASLMLVNSLGQVIQSEMVLINEPARWYPLQFPAGTIPGIYSVFLFTEKQKSTTKIVVIYP